MPKYPCLLSDGCCQCLNETKSLGIHSTRDRSQFRQSGFLSSHFTLRDRHVKLAMLSLAQAISSRILLTYHPMSQPCQSLEIWCYSSCTYQSKYALSLWWLKCPGEKHNIVDGNQSCGDTDSISWPVIVPRWDLFRVFGHCCMRGNLFAGVSGIFWYSYSVINDTFIMVLSWSLVSKLRGLGAD